MSMYQSRHVQGILDKICSKPSKLRYAAPGSKWIHKINKNIVDIIQAKDASSLVYSENGKYIESRLLSFNESFEPLDSNYNIYDYE